MGELQKLGIGLVIFVAVIAIIAIVGNLPTEDELKNSDLTRYEVMQQALEDVPVQELYDSNSRYVGKIIHLEGSIQQVSQYDDAWVLHIAADGQKESGEYGILLRHAAETEPEVLSDIKFYGTVTGTMEDLLLTGQALYFVTVDALIVEE